MNFGTYLLIWLAVGFACGIKEVYVKQTLDSDRVKNIADDFYNVNAKTESTEKAFRLITNKKVFIAITTLLSFIPLILDMMSLLKKAKNKISKG